MAGRGVIVGDEAKVGGLETEAWLRLFALTGRIGSSSRDMPDMPVMIASPCLSQSLPVRA